MTFDELFRAILELCPGAMADEDSNGQLVIRTGLKEIVVGGELVPIPEDRSSQ